jgi:UDP-N-acetylglucosamine--N-acetylmuramyl-(pentapeptide) pyrophosphoryl-undecaprenol N-acetylglucosamine transferase
MNPKTEIVFSGGGSGGHTVAALSIIDFLDLDEYSISYVGSYSGIEKDLVTQLGISYKAISTGKLRRYFSWENFLDFFKFSWGIVQSFAYLMFRPKIKIIFSTGGFVAVPIVIAGRVLGKKVFIHEQTTRVGLANKISSFFAHKIFVSFESSLKYFPKHKTILSGYPLRKEIYNIASTPKKNNSLSKIFITGGGNGSKKLNDFILKNLRDLQKDFSIVHQVGKQFLDEFKEYATERYQVCGFIGKEMIQYLTEADIVISRAGAGTVSELIYLNKKAIFIPLKIAQKNEQFHNAEEALKKIKGKIILEDDLDNVNLRQEIDRLLRIESINKSSQINKAQNIILQNIIKLNKL